MSQHVIPIRTNLIIFAALMGLLVLTVAVALLIDARPIIEIPIALSIAIVKAVLIMLYFMHLKFSNRLTWLFATASTLWLVILISFLITDFLSRGKWLRGPLITEDSGAARYFVGADPHDESGTYTSTFETTGKTARDAVPSMTSPPTP